MKTVISDLSDLPAWFDLDKYRWVSDFDLATWYVELKIRNTYYSCPHTAMKGKLASAGLLRYDHFSHYDEPSIETPIPGKSLQPSYIIENGEVLFTQPISNTSGRLTMNNFTGPVFELLDDDKGRYSLPESLQDRSSVSVFAIDMTAPDAEIIKRMQSKIGAMRGPELEELVGSSSDGTVKNRIKKNIIRNFSEKEIQGWHDCQLLPYLDLTHWATLNKTEFTNKLLGSALFPDNETKADPENIRKSTERTAKIVTSFGSLLAIEAAVGIPVIQAYPELSARIRDPKPIN